ncbi:MAG: hypothetical protein J6T02_02080 [Bacteroidales bacterium]|nr:hypothetical protein [Bacteroidales bacterium]
MKQPEKHFEINDKFDKYTETRTIGVSAINYSNSYGKGHIMYYESSPEGETIYNLIEDNDICLCDGIERIDANKRPQKPLRTESVYFRYPTFSIKELETICESKKVELKSCEWESMLIIPTARVLYNAAISERYPVNEIESLYDQYKAAVKADRKAANKFHRRERWKEFGKEFGWGLLKVVLIILGIILGIVLLIGVYTLWLS